jgi:hypothetical protein
MCTVTYLPLSNGYLLTSNRDEKEWRSKAIPPQEYNNLFFPKDQDKGGTWICTRKDNITLCLLNGAFIAHKSLGNYKQSRGVILLQIAASDNPFNTIETIELSNIEPFTLIITNGHKLSQLKWDGINKHINSYNPNQAKIWSSVTLYNSSQQQLREEWFQNWLDIQENYTVENVMGFHQNTGDGNPEHSLLMNRSNKVFTVSITSVHVYSNHQSMHYLDLNNKALSQMDIHTPENLYI